MRTINQHIGKIASLRLIYDFRSRYSSFEQCEYHLLHIKLDFGGLPAPEVAKPGILEPRGREQDANLAFADQFLDCKRNPGGGKPHEDPGASETLNNFVDLGKERHGG